MMIKMLHPAILILLVFAPYGVCQAAEMKIDCILKGGSVVQLTAEACQIEGGSPVIQTAPPATLPDTAAEGFAGIQPPANPKLAAAQQSIVALLGKQVVDASPFNSNPEGIERSARFEGCRLMVNEHLHIKYGNLFSSWKDFKISSVIDFQKIKRDEFGILGEVGSLGGALKGTAVYFEEREGEGHFSISVLVAIDGGFEKYRTHGFIAYLSSPRDDLWIQDKYGYPKDNGLGNELTDRVRILLIMSSQDEAEKLKDAMVDILAICKQ